MGTYLEKVLQPGETVIATGRLHGIRYVKPILNIVLSLVALGFVKKAAMDATWLYVLGAWSLYGVIDLIHQKIRGWTTEIFITNKRVLYKRGLIMRKTMEMNMNKVESVAVDQNILGRMLNYGTVSILGSGGGLESMHAIKDPLALRNSITVH